MGLFDRNIISNTKDAIGCDEQMNLVWKWQPDGNNNKDCSIKMGTRLKVEAGLAVVFVCNTKYGMAIDYVEGPFDDKLETNVIPFVSDFMGLEYGSRDTFAADVYFVNIRQTVQTKFGVPYFAVYDSQNEENGVPVAIRGTLSYRIADCMAFAKLNELEHFSVESLTGHVVDIVRKSAKAVVANAPEEYEVPTIQLEKKLEQINDAIREKAEKAVAESLGVAILKIDILAIDIDRNTTQEVRDIRS